MNHVGVSPLLTGPHVSYVILLRQLDNDFLRGYLAQGSVVISSYSVSPDNPRDRDVVFNDGENIRVAKAVARYLRLSEPFAVSRQDLDGRPDARTIKQRVNERAIVCATKVLRAQLRILVKKSVEIDSPPFAKPASDDRIRRPDAYQGRAACRFNVRFSGNQTAEFLCVEAPTRAVSSYHQLPCSRL